MIASWVVRSGGRRRHRTGRPFPQIGVHAAERPTVGGGLALAVLCGFAPSCVTADAAPHREKGDAGIAPDTGRAAEGAAARPVSVPPPPPPPSVPARVSSLGALPPSAGSPKTALLQRLSRLNESDHFLFGQQHATLWGMYLDGALVSTNKWFESTARAGRFTSDSEAVVGDAPAVLGVSLGMLAFEPTEWNRRPAIAAAIRRQIDQGGVVTMDWHAPSCDAALAPTSPSVPPPKPLATVTVDGRDVPIWPVPGGASFYAEEEYTHTITSRADVPDALKCLCQVANDLPLTAGAYRGTTGKTWLVAQAKHAAQVLRAEGLADMPIIVRPFHEHTGAWFWWGEPYWNCAALLDKGDAVSGPAAYKEMARAFISALKGEPGMSNLVFAYSTDKVLGAREKERFSAAQNKVTDPSGYARDRLRDRLQGDLARSGLGYFSAVRRAAVGVAPPTTTTTGARAKAYVAQRRALYIEAYAGDDVYHVLGIDLYHPMARPANDADLRLLGLQLRVLGEEARARGKPYALTEAGSYRLQLERLASAAKPGGPIVVNGKSSVDEALARLFDASDRAALLRYFQMTAAGPISMSARERAAVVPKVPEDWFTQQLLVLAKQSKVAFALVWQTYYDSTGTDRYFNYYVPYPGHPEAANFRRFYDDPATCFLRDACER